MALVTAKHGDLFVLVGKYPGRGVKTNWRCAEGHDLFSSLENILAAPGCKRCSGKVNNHEEYLDELRVRFGGKVCPTERYRGSRVQIGHECINGHTFLQCPNQVLNSVLGCCSEFSKNNRRSNGEYDKELKEIHGDRVFRIGDYVGSNERILHGCGLCGNEWLAPPGAIKHQESGCRECAVYGFKMREPAFVYYLRIVEKVTGNHYFKIGITNRDVELRVAQMVQARASVEVITAAPFAVGEEAHSVEQQILKDFEANLVQNCTLLKNGNSEVFNKDISEYLSCYFTSAT